MSVYFISGCGRGIGLAMTQHLLARGDRVIGSVRGSPPPITHKNLRTVTFDVRDQAAIDAAADLIDESVDVLVNNAGIAGEKGGPAYEVDLADFAEVLDVNVLGPLRVTRAFIPLLRRSKGAKVMTISSQLGGMTYPGGADHTAYCASKAALNKVMQAVANDLATEGIPLVIAHPGWVRTDMGGPAASIDPDRSAAGLTDLIDQLTIQTTGRFMNWDGTQREW
jgi:NAD(P)-dependent dehydrogenase (short-subunit alcohol dehydrogenase family)